MDDVDVVVIGSGQAGVPLAVRMAAAGKRVVIAERGELGGTCINTGCTPTKTLVASARAAHVARTAGRLGVTARELTVDFAAVMARKDAIVARWRAGVARRLDGAGERLRLCQRHARLVGPHEVQVGDERFRAAAIVLNVGARPTLPPVPGLDAVPFVDNHGLLDLRALPRHLVVLGGGYIGCELGQAFRRFGAEVTIVDRNPHLLHREDVETSAALEQAFRAEDIALALGTAAEGVRSEGGDIAVRVGGRDIRGSHLLVAMGRRPNTDDLGCEAAGVKLDERGSIVVDDGYATSAPGIYAVGDATGGPQFTHTSWDDHRILVDRLLGRPARGRNGRVIPFTVFTDPQVARVGLTEREARARGVRHEAASMEFGAIARAIELDETAGTMKILIDPDTENILGCTVVGAEAGELIHIAVALMQAGATARAIVDAEFAHPTFAEGVQSLVMRLPRYALG